MQHKEPLFITWFSCGLPYCWGGGEKFFISRQGICSTCLQVFVVKQGVISLPIPNHHSNINISWQRSFPNFPLLPHEYDCIQILLTFFQQLFSTQHNFYTLIAKMICIIVNIVLTSRPSSGGGEGLFLLPLPVVLFLAPF